ncbi:TrmB family transcriptional regulator sugar-binding domain-containing protein [Halorubrum vacuolatum]|uniref:Transcriptional regulator n=1 Tax=Halorubrum vacuolatum TaxID=63740 RepID=A0A238UXA9_HALVU|nr:TrmB family transcriptional regulator sugar-binding domain-containing protein [Halorubrum vacuolatum]SNR25963.1 transcriptional regulator [Halorubrum vacuolatum]
MDDRTLSELLTGFGLSEKEVDTYLSLLEHGEAKASTIAAAAGVSKRYVYSVSESLAARGFVEVNDHAVPTTIRATPPEEVIERLRSDVEAMRPALEERFAQVEPDVEQFEVVKSRVTVLKRIRTLIEGADEELTLSLPAPLLEEFRDPLVAAVDRGVLVLLILSGAGDEAVEPPDTEGVASVVRRWEAAMPTLLTADSAVGMVAPAELLQRANSDRQAIVFAQAQLAPVIAGSFLGNYWPVAVETWTAGPATLPAEYVNFRHAAFQATVHRRAGTTLRATVGGRDTAANEPVEVTGEVSAVRQSLVEPTNNEFPVQHTIVIETEDGTVAVGGRGAFVEDVEADLVRLEAE